MPLPQTPATEGGGPIAATPSTATPSILARASAMADGFLAWWNSRLSPTPDLSRPAQVVALALGVTVCIWAFLLRNHPMSMALGDTDDATRLVIVRDLVAGRGWYDQALPRMAPPAGTWLHWSRLLDGALAATLEMFRPFVGPAKAEWMMRDIWPLAWIPLAVTGALGVARGLGTRAAVLLTGPLILINMPLFRQFLPGRIDHHNVQITMTLIALACAVTRGHRARWAAVGGVATGLGLAVGLEALAFHALIGASYGLDLARDRKAAAPAAAYGLSLAIAAALFAAAQTPPWRWSLSFCDALSLNLVAALAVAGLGLTGAAAVAGRVPAWARLALLAAAAAAAAGAYLGLSPECIHGPFATMDPRARPIWFDHIQEVQPLPRMLKIVHATAVIAIVMMAMGLGAGGVLLIREGARPRTATLLIGACLVVASVTAYLTWRMQDYAFWIGTPALGAALSILARRWMADKAIPSLAATLILNPSIVGATVVAADDATTPVAARHAPPANPGARCFDPRAYGPLARLPAGVVLASPDLGPFILAFTHHSVLVAPYHRLSREIVAAHDALDAPPALAEARVRRLKANYVVDCPLYPMFLHPGSFGARLSRAPPPPWLTELSASGASLRIYRPRPPRSSG